MGTTQTGKDQGEGPRSAKSHILSPNPTTVKPIAYCHRECFVISNKFREAHSQQGVVNATILPPGNTSSQRLGKLLAQHSEVTFYGRFEENECQLRAQNQEVTLTQPFVLGEAGKITKGVMCIVARVLSFTLVMHSKESNKKEI